MLAHAAVAGVTNRGRNLWLGYRGHDLSCPGRLEHVGQVRRADDKIGFPRGERQGGGRVSERRVERGAVASFGVLARGTNGAFRSPREHLALQTRLTVALGCGLEYLWVGGKWIMEIPVDNLAHRFAHKSRQPET
jgi:hypothetical protein